MEWTLQERLEKAQEQRRLEAGLPPISKAAEPPVDESAATAEPIDLDAEREQRRRELLIDLRDPSSVFTYRTEPRASDDEPAAEPIPLARGSVR
jgi:hypothetical protein